MKIKIILFSLLSLLIIPELCSAMPIGTLLYRTTNEGKMYGKNTKELIEVENGIMKGIRPGHVGIYVGEENGVKYVVETLSTGVVKNPLDKFINTSLGEELVGARIPKGISDIARAKAVTLARSIAEANLGYDFDFMSQKGPGDGEWTCVGLVEKVYESSNTSNPFDLSSLEYNQDNYGIDITPDGFDDYSVYNEKGDCFSTSKEFSYITPRNDFILPFPETAGGYDTGLIKDDKRYIFLPYTQYLQDSLEDVEVDEVVSSSFPDKEVRGEINESSLVLRWSLINNPVSRIKSAFNKQAEKVKEISTKIVQFFKGEKEGEIEEVEMAVMAENKENDNRSILKTEKDSNSKISGLDVRVKGEKDEKGEEIKEIILEEGRKIKETKEPKRISLNYEEIISETKNNDSNLINNEEGLESDLRNENNIEKEYISTSSSFFKDSMEIDYEEAERLSQIEVEGKELLEEIESDVENSEKLDKSIYISKIYAEDNNEFVELYNPNNYAIDLKEEGYRLEKARTASNPSILVRIGDDSDGNYPGGTIIPALGYYLIANIDARDYLKDRADALVSRDSFSLNNKKQSLFLGISAISSYDDPDIVDLVGYGDEAKYFLGEAPATEIINYHFLNRISYNFDNSSDFNQLLFSDPEAIAAWQEENQSDIPGSDYEDDNNNSNDNNNEEEDDEIEEELEIIENGLTRLYIQAVGAENNNDFIKIINRSNYDIDLAKFSVRLEKAVTTENPSILIRIGDMADAAYPGGTIIKKGESYLIVKDKADDYLLSIADAIVIRNNFIITNSEQSIYLGVNAISSPTDEDIIDLLGFGEEATYFSGEAPAPSITDNMILYRQSYTSDNSYDYLLKSKYDYFNLEEPEEDNADEDSNNNEEDDNTDEDNDNNNNEDNSNKDDTNEDSNNNEDDNTNEDNNNDNNNDNEELSFPTIIDNYRGDIDYLYDSNTSIKSDDIEYLNHFNDCTMANGYPVVGKWGCGKEMGRYMGSFYKEFENEIDLNNSSIGFYFRYFNGWPLVNLTLGNNNDNLGISFEPGEIFLSGVLGNESFPLANDTVLEDYDYMNNWHYFNLVLNRDDNVLIMLIDGEELFRLNIENTNLFSATNMSLSGGDSSLYFDELSLWKRALTTDEINNYIAEDKEFFPLDEKREPLDLQPLYDWDFENALSTSSKDSLHNQKIIYLENSILETGDNKALKLSTEISQAKLPNYIFSRDFSISMWWKNMSFPNDGQVVFSLSDQNEFGEHDKFSYFANSYERSLTMKYRWREISSGLNEGFPYDADWHHIVLTYDSVNFSFKMYVDNELKNEISLTPHGPGEGIFNLIKLESRAEASLIDNLKIYSGVLTENDISYLSTEK